MTFYKNIVTGGGYDKLKNEEREFKKTVSSYKLMEESYIALNQTQLNALHYLKNERQEVVKNLSLSKNLIGRIKTIAKDKKQEVKNDFINYIENEHVEVTIGNVSINFQDKLDNVSETFMKSLDSSFERINNKSTFTKADLKVELASVAVETLIQGVSQVINLNSEVIERRKHIVNSTKQIVEMIAKMSNQAPIIYGEVKRMMEIASVLNKHNQVFSVKYAAINKEINKNSKIRLFIKDISNRKIIPDDKIMTHLHPLIKYSTEYSNFNKNANL
ncbi:hypothetical protein [Flavobacterium frigidarium]|uniref:hypothetical protein n=1 Tax=Flavobacterium frigidarium TaxID=99286 RepID=UPI0004178907|nr:hypothetical protein [Flavobacterium frigidarium]